MKDNTLKKEIKICEAYARKAPKTIDEAINFETDDNTIAADEMSDVGQEHMPVHHEEQHCERLNVEEFVNDIRMKALKGMAELADCPDSGEYQILKKIWQICDKKPEEQKAQEGLK